MIEALLLAIGLSMDASAVAAARGASARSLASRDFWLLPLLFGGFQAAMSAAGWQGARWSAKYIDSWDHWLAFALLVGIGAKMLRDGLRSNESGEPSEVAPRRSSLVMDLSLAVATSLDAAAAGVSLPSIPMQPAITVALIGGVTAALSALGFVVGCRVGDRIGRAATAFGGMVLIGIGVRLLWVALSAG
jgi:manganese efflux pump family protein